MAVVIGAVHVVTEAPRVCAPRLIDADERVPSPAAMGCGLLPPEPDPAAHDLRLPPGRLGENAGAMGLSALARLRRALWARRLWGSTIRPVRKC
jgi:hypothetical protein